MKRIVVCLAATGAVLFAYGAYSGDDRRALICHPGYSASIRPPTRITDAIKLSMLPPDADPTAYELDHIVPLCLDGPPIAATNLQIQLWGDARKKDRLERMICHAYCAPGSTMSLDDAQEFFSSGQWKVIINLEETDIP